MFIFVLSVMCDLFRSCCASMITVIAGDGSFLHAIVIRLGLAGDGSFLHAILMDIVVLEMYFLHAFPLWI